MTKKKAAARNSAPAVNLDGDDVLDELSPAVEPVAEDTPAAAAAPDPAPPAAAAPDPAPPAAAAPDPIPQEMPTAKPTFPAFLAGPKTQRTAGDGSGGRPWVYSTGGIRRERQDDIARPRCPACTRDDVAVLCTATSSQEVTHYKCPCPNCTFRTQRLRPGVAAQMRAQHARPTAPSYVERPN